MPLMHGSVIVRPVVERNLGSINLNLLTALDALLAESNVTRAAQRVGLSQSAMSHSLSQLRALFDDPILVRSGKGMQATPRAEALAGPLRAHLKGLQQLIHGPPDFSPLQSERSLRIATADFVAAKLGPQLLQQFSREAPGVQVVLRPVDIANYDRALEQGEVDLVVAPGTKAQRALQHELLREDPFVCVARQGHPQLSGGSLSLQKYLDLEHLLVSPSESGRAFVDSALHGLGHRRVIRARVFSFTVAPMIIARTELVLTTVRSSVSLWSEALGLQLFEPPVDLEPLRLQLIWHERDELDPGHQWMRQQVLQLMQ